MNRVGNSCPQGQGHQLTSAVGVLTLAAIVLMTTLDGGVAMYDDYSPRKLLLMAALGMLVIGGALSSGWLPRIHQMIRSLMPSARSVTTRIGPIDPQASTDLFLATPVPGLLIDCVSQRVLASNLAASALYGYSGEQFGRLSLRDLVGDESPRQSELERLFPGQSHGISAGLATHRRADGSSLRVETNVQRAQFAGRAVWLVTVADVTARVELARQLEESERHYRELVDLSLGMVFTHDLEGRLESVNPAFARGLGYRQDELLGRDLIELVAPREHYAYAQYLSRIAQQGCDAGSAGMRCRNGEERIWEYRNQLRTGVDGRTHVLCFAIDVSERHQHERELLDISRRDPLTGCYNRRFLDLFEARATADSCWGCVVVDVDHFKKYNDTKGHQAGDQALVRTAQFLQGLVRDQDAVLRLGGDEFAIILGQTDTQRLAAFAQRLQDAIARRSPPVPISFGVALREARETLAETLHRADREMIERRVDIRRASGVVGRLSR